MKIKVGKKVTWMGHDLNYQPIQRQGKVSKIVNRDLVEVNSGFGNKFIVGSRNLRIVGQ
jgi:hypothetical protein